MNIGIDRILLKNLNIEQINTEILKKKGFVVIQDNETNIRIFKDAATGEETKINYIKVSKTQDKALLLNELRIGRMETERAVFNQIDYEHLDITLPNSLSIQRINDKNINTSLELKQALGEVEKELEYLGFGKVDLMDTELKELEINCNIELERPFNEYERVLDYINSLLPSRLKSVVNAKYKAKDDTFTGFKAGNGSITLKMYDKRTNILKKTGIDIEKELLRVEYSLLNEQKIKDTFGSNKLKDIDFKELAETYKDLLYDDVVKRIYKDINKQLNHAIREIKAYKAIGGISAIDNYLKNYQSNLLDIEIVLSALKEIERPNHYSRQSKKTIKSAMEIEGITLFGNINKINEILKALEYKEIKLNMTKGIEKEVKKHY